MSPRSRSSNSRLEGSSVVVAMKTEPVFQLGLESWAIVALVS
jgi:hypothetical protein